jgi:hypothetical protein
MFNNLKNILIGSLAAVLVIAIGASVYSAYASPDTNPSVNTPTPYGNGNGNSNGNGNRNGTANANGTGITNIPASEVSAEEAASLLYMREEEKLARDVYNALYATWGQPTFQNIASSEQTHMDAVKQLLDRYGLTDPALAPGQFTDPNLQALYNQLVAQGSTSLTDALNVGAQIEQTDIADLQSRLTQTDNADIQFVYNNLLSGSYNHLAAFTGKQGNNGQGGQGGHGRPNWAGSGRGQNQQP